MMRRTTNICAVLGCVFGLMMAMATDAEASQNEQERTAGIVEVSVGPYMPMVDAGFRDGPYQDFFGSSAMLHFEGEVDYHLWQGFGKLSLGLHAGYARVIEPMRTQDGQVVDPEETSRFRIIPLKTSLVYRYDYSAHHHNIPLVPMAKVGLNYNFWRVTDAAGDTMEGEDGSRAVGGKAGWHASLGLNLHLDFLDPAGAAGFLMNWGIHNSYLYGEYTWNRASAFSGEGLNLGANHWSIGLAFEF